MLENTYMPETFLGCITAPVTYNKANTKRTPVISTELEFARKIEEYPRS